MSPILVCLCQCILAAVIIPDSSEIEMRLLRIQKVEDKKPFYATRLKLEAVRLRVSRDDIRYSGYAPDIDLDVFEPKTLVMDSTVAEGLEQFFWGTISDQKSTMTEYSEINTPNECLRVHRIITRSINSVSVLVERRRKIPINSVGNQAISTTVEWYRSLRDPRMASVVVVDDCDTESIHVLVKQYMFLYFLKGTKIAVSPIFISPPRSLGLRNGCARTRRFLAMKQYGVSLTTFMRAYPVKPIPLLETLQIGRQLMKVIFKLHAMGIAHGSICTDAFVFASKTNLKKGFRLTSFYNSVADERGLSMVALGDLKMLFSILTDMNPHMLSLATEKQVSRKGGRMGDVTEYLVCIHIHLWTHLLVSDVDYGRIFDCFDSAIGVLSNKF